MVCNGSTPCNFANVKPLLLDTNQSGLSRNQGHFANKYLPSHVFQNQSSPLLVNKTERRTNRLHRSAAAAASPRSTRWPTLAPWRRLGLAPSASNAVPASVTGSALPSAADSPLCMVLVQPMDDAFHPLVLMNLCCPFQR
jgi:hypothetical protein